MYVKFAYPNAKFEAIGNPFIQEKELSRLVDSESLSAFKDSVNTLKDYNVDGAKSDELQQSLDGHLIQTIKMMREDSSKQMNDFFDVYTEKLDISLIKNELKRKIEGKNIEESETEKAVLPSTRELLQKLIDAEKKDLPEILKKYGFEQVIIDKLLDENVDNLAIDNAIDNYIINKFKQIKVPYRSEEPKQKFINHMIDIRNLKNILRAKHLGYDKEPCKKLFLGEGQEIASWKLEELAEVDDVSQVISSIEGTSYYNVLKDAIEQYHKEASVQVLENALDSIFLKLVKDISLKNYTNIGPSIRFLVSKEYEIKNLKIIVKGLSEKLSSDIIKDFLIVEAGT
jgi:V/A-type H+-transporting ATPase subunit C